MVSLEAKGPLDLMEPMDSQEVLVDLVSSCTCPQPILKYAVAMFNKWSYVVSFGQES